MQEVFCAAQPLRCSDISARQVLEVLFKSGHSTEQMMSGLLSAWVLPPLNAVLLLIAGLLVRRWRPRLGLGLLLGGTALLWFCGAPVVAERSLRAIEVNPPAGPFTGTGAGAIVILSGETYLNAPEYGADTVGPFTLERLRYGARLHRQPACRYLQPGADTGHALQHSGADADALEQDFATPVRWLEPTSMTLWRMRPPPKSCCERGRNEDPAGYPRRAHAARAPGLEHAASRWCRPHGFPPPMVETIPS
jgi:hypothetical protein